MNQQKRKITRLTVREQPVKLCYLLIMIWL
jgi:hypothetical protein